MVDEETTLLRCRRAWDPRPPKRVDDGDDKSDGVLHVAANIVVVVVVVVVVVRTEKKKKKKKKKKNEIGKWR